MSTKGLILGPLSDETKRKISLALNKQVSFNCDNCGKYCKDKISAFNKKKRHFCSRSCYSIYRRDKMPIEDHPRFGKGHGEEESKKRRKARSILNHYLRDKKIARPKCEVCGDKQTEAHHDDYNKPLDVRWFCFTHHRQYHKIGLLIYEHPHLLNTEK